MGWAVSRITSKVGVISGDKVSKSVMRKVGDIVSTTTIGKAPVCGVVTSALVTAAVLMIIVPSS